MPDDKAQVSHLETTILLMQQQLATLTELVIRQSKPAEAPAPQPQIAQPQPAPAPVQVIPDAGTYIENGKLVYSKGPLPSDRKGLVGVNTQEDHVEKYFRSKTYGMDGNNGVIESPRGHQLTGAPPKGQGLPPKTAAEMPELDYPTNFSGDEEEPEETDYIDTLTPAMQSFIGLMIGTKRVATPEQFIDDICSAMSGMIGHKVNAVSVYEAKSCVESLYETIKEPFLRDNVIKATPQFLAYMETLALAPKRVQPSVALQAFLDGIEKQDLTSEKTRLSVTLSGEKTGYNFAEGLLLYRTEDPGAEQFFLLGGPSINPVARDAAEGFLKSSVISGDVVVVTANSEKHRYSIRYTGHEIDKYGNLVVYFTDGLTLNDEEPEVPDLSQYFPGYPKEG